MSTHKQVDRRTFMRGALATAALVPAGGVLAACAGGGSAGAPSTGKTGKPSNISASNPFGMAANSDVDAVVFKGGLGTDYVQFAGDLLAKNHPGSSVKITPSTAIAQQLQPRFVAGNPPDLIDDSGAGNIGISTILDKVEDLSDVFAASNLEGTKISDTLFGGAKKPGTFGDKFAAINVTMTVYGIWYSASLFQQNGWTAPKTWAEALDLGNKAKAKGKYLCLWGKEAASYYLWLCMSSAIKQGGEEVRLALDNLKPNCWSHPAVQGAFNGLHDIVKAGYMKPGGAGTQFTKAQAQWSNKQDALLYPSGSWIQSEMKDQTKAGFQMTGAPEFTVDSNSALPYQAVHAAAGEPFLVPSDGKNAAGAKELLRIMLSKDAAANLSKTNNILSVVKGTVPPDGFGSTALASQSSMLEAAGDNVYTWQFIDLYGINPDQLVVMNSFLSGKTDVAGLTSRLQKITDDVPSSKRIQIS